MVLQFLQGNNSRKCRFTLSPMPDARLILLVLVQIKLSLAGTQQQGMSHEQRHQLGW